MRTGLTIPRALVERMTKHARAVAPEECCGLLGGRGGVATSVYELRNASERAEVAYEAAPEELFAAQRLMRERGETLAAIYHSHTRESDPLPSEADVRLAFYPEAIYLIVGFDRDETVVRAFRIFEREGRYERVGLVVTE